MRPLKKMCSTQPLGRCDDQALWVPQLVPASSQPTSASPHVAHVATPSAAGGGTPRAARAATPCFFGVPAP